MTYRDILYETDDRLAFITLNRPEKLNALNNNLRGELMEAMREAEHDESVGVIVLIAAGRSLSAGYDLSPEAIGEEHPELRRVAIPARSSPIPGPRIPARRNGRATW